MCCNSEYAFYFFYSFLRDMNLSVFVHAPGHSPVENIVSAVAFSLISALAQAADDKFIFSQTFYLITVPSHLLVLPLPVCFRGNPSFVSQGSSANWENLNLSSELKQLERI